MSYLRLFASFDDLRTSFLCISNMYTIEPLVFCCIVCLTVPMSRARDFYVSVQVRESCLSQAIVLHTVSTGKSSGLGHRHDGNIQVSMPCRARFITTGLAISAARSLFIATMAHFPTEWDLFLLKRCPHRDNL